MIFFFKEIMIMEGLEEKKYFFSDFQKEIIKIFLKKFGLLSQTQYLKKYK